MWEAFELPGISVNWYTYESVYVLWFAGGGECRFNSYADAICFLYNHVYNNAIELSLESMIKLTKEYNKIEAR